MKRRAFLVTALSAAAGLACRRPKVEAIPKADGTYVLRKKDDTVEWVTLYAFGRGACSRVYGRPFFSINDYGSVKGVGTQEVLGPPGFRVIGEGAR